MKRSRKVSGGIPARCDLHRRSAFTLVELLVVISILSLLIAILLPSLARARRSAKAAFCASNLKQVGTAFTLYVNDHEDRYPSAEDPVSTSPFNWLWMGRGFREFVGPYLVEDINTENPSVLVCPDDRTSPNVFERTSYAYSMAFYHSPEQIDAMSSPADTYSNPQPPIPQMSSNVRRPSDKILSGEWYSNHERIPEDGGWWDQRGSRVFLFADGHADKHDAGQIVPANDGLPDPNLTISGIRGADVR